MSNTYIGINGIARLVKGGYVGVDGVARKVKKAYIGVDGVARLCFETSDDAAGTEGLAYELSQDATYYTCTGIGTATDTDIVIASEIDGIPVTSIDSWAFNNCTGLTSIEIPDSVTSIGKYAFYKCTSLTNITVSSDNQSYKSVDGNLYSKDGKTLVQYAIGKTDTSFVIPDSVTSIGYSAFEYCTSLTSIEIPDSVTSIDSWAFNKCTGLTDVYYGGTQAQWEEIDIRAYNGALTSATIHYNSEV